ncbi:MAG: porin [Acidobacteria bacterium]|nr:porin [Acidobacteriota bacterium]
MSAKYVIGSLLALAPMLASAQDAKSTETTGEFTVEGRKVDVDPKSAKYNEYSDTRNGFPHYKVGLEWVDAESGNFLDLKGMNLLRDDQSVSLGFGKFGLWSLVVDRNETPHNLSFKAMTPFRNQGQGLYTVDSTAGIPNQHLAGTAAQMLANDAATAAWLPGQLRPTSLGTQRDKTGATFTLTPTEHLKFRLVLSDEQRSGTKVGYGSIGDRPPRTLNVQLAEPLDFSSRELRLEAEYNRSRYQAQLTYTVSKFENNIDAFRWQNIYTDNVAGTTYDQWTSHRVATFGQKPLSPDNQYQNATLSLGVNLPLASRLSISAAFGKMEQDKALLPYATSDFGNTGGEDFSSAEVLPRHSAKAEIATKRINVDYSLTPISRLNLRAYFRYYDLDNRTPTSAWWYVTDDTLPGSATATLPLEPTEFNKRRNLAFAYTQTTKGVEASTYFGFWRTSLGVSVEQENMDRDFREADTDETILKATLRTRPTKWLSLRGKILFGNREGSKYDYNAPASSYWYEQAELAAGELNASPRFSFINHPDMRKFDASDRKRNEWDLTAVLAPTDALDISLSYRDRRDDFDSDVKSIQPLLGNTYAATDADRNSFTPGDQLGLLENNTQRFAVDVSYAWNERFVLNAFASRESIEASQRGLEFNENNKLNPTLASLGTSELGAWTRASSQWMAVTEDETDTYGLGATYQIVPGKLTLSAEYAYSNGTVDITYSGFGAVSAVNPANPLADIYQFAFRTPPTVRSKQTSLNAKLAYQVSKHLRASLHYAYDRYDVSDWMQEANTPWVESVGSQYFLRDTSSATSNQWGNRLVNLGSYLAPTYDAHYVGVSLSYKF